MLRAHTPKVAPGPERKTTGADRLHPRHAPYGQSGAGVPQNTSERTSQPAAQLKPDADQMRLAHKRRLAMLRAHTPKVTPEPGGVRLLKHKTRL